MHVGAPKTGTTAVQNSLFRQRETLQAHGTIYPLSGTLGKGQNGHHNLVYEVAPGFRSIGKFHAERGGWGEVRAEIKQAGAHTAVVSAEGLFRQARPARRALRWFRDFDITIVIYLRRQDQYFEAGYNQLARFGRTLEDFSAFVDTSRRIINYRHFIENWQTYHSNAKIICVPFQSEFIGADIVRDFSKRCLNGVVVASQETANQRAGLKTVRAAQYIRQKGVEHLGDSFAISAHAAAGIRRIFTERFSDIYDYSFCDTETASRIIAESEETNRWLASTFPGFDEDYFFIPPAADAKRSGLPKFSFSAEEIAVLDTFANRLISETIRATVA